MRETTLFNWEDFLALAEELSGMPEEASRRSAISRAYYAAYHAASAYIRREGLIEPDHGLSHRMVWRLFRTSVDVQRQDIGWRGHRLKRLRENADYRSPYPGDIDTDVRNAAADARALVAAITSLN